MDACGLALHCRTREWWRNNAVNNHIRGMWIFVFVVEFSCVGLCELDFYSTSVWLATWYAIQAAPPAGCKYYLTSS